ncbi:MAG: ribosome biogenesis GTP-binding protein YihA/YsxC [Bacteroidales bacterium]|nr:YihA family ribosome biogenesis GTP-binding protein [Bacteroidales bacterium]MBS3774942.1 YihA family ribosome biogenesis GTP-binding protein [Bacteroidales bacterium]
MKITKAEFVKSSTQISQLPGGNLPEFAFVGRSNVGKSSLINMLLEKKQLAHISQKPGKTRTINHYIINDSWYMVDLPGYGYAQTSKKERKEMLRFIKDYILYAPNLINLFVLLDAKIKPQSSDLNFMEWLGINEIPFTMVFTKMDKISSSELSKNMAQYRQEMLKKWEFLPMVINSSAVKKQGREEILNYIEELLNYC